MKPRMSSPERDSTRIEAARIIGLFCYEQMFGERKAKRDAAVYEPEAVDFATADRVLALAAADATAEPPSDERVNGWTHAEPAHEFEPQWCAACALWQAKNLPPTQVVLADCDNCGSERSVKVTIVDAAAPSPVTEGAGFERHVTQRCPNQRGHMDEGLPIPCEDCYSIEDFWRRIPWEPDSTAPAAEGGPTRAELALRDLRRALPKRGEAGNLGTFSVNRLHNIIDDALANYDAGSVPTPTSGDSRDNRT